MEFQSLTGASIVNGKIVHPLGNIEGTVEYRVKAGVTRPAGAIASGVLTLQTTPANVAPVAAAGADNIITLPTNSVTLTGSGTDADGTVASYAWNKLSGPAATINTPNEATTTVTGLTEGVYVFQLTVTDNQGATHADDVQITVNAAQALPKNPAPTNIRIDDDFNTIDFTYNGSTSYLDYEYFVNDPSTPSTFTQKPQTIGNIAASTGNVGVRRKASSGFAASDWLYSNAPFTQDFTAPQQASLSTWLMTDKRVDLYDDPATGTTLATPAAIGDTTIQVVAATTMKPYLRVRIDTEIAYIKSVSGTTVTLETPLSAAHATGVVVVGSQVERFRDMKDTSNTGIATLGSATAAVAPYFFRNSATGARWAFFDQKRAKMTTGKTLSGTITEFFVGQLFNNGTGYLDTTSAGDGTPAFYITAGDIKHYAPAASPMVKAAAHTAGIFVLGLRYTNGGQRQVFYADATTAVTKVVDIAAAVDFSALSFNGIGRPNAAETLDFGLREFALYGSIALPEADMLTWMEHLRNKHCVVTNTAPQ